MGGVERGVVVATDIIVKVPSLPPARGADCDASIITNDTVQIGKNQSLITWATTNDMGGQLVGNGRRQETGRRIQNVDDLSSGSARSWEHPKRSGRIQA